MIVYCFPNEARIQENDIIIEKHMKKTHLPNSRPNIITYFAYRLSKSKRVNFWQIDVVAYSNVFKIGKSAQRVFSKPI